MGRIGSVSLVCSVLLLARLGLARVGQDRDGVTLGVTGEVHHNAGEGVSDSGSEGGHGHHHNHDHDQEEVRVTKQVEKYNVKEKHKHHHEKEEDPHHKEQRGEEDHSPTKHDHKGGKNHQHEEHSQEKVKHKDQSHAEPDQEEEQDLSNTLAGIHRFGSITHHNPSLHPHRQSGRLIWESSIQSIRYLNKRSFGGRRNSGHVINWSHSPAQFGWPPWAPLLSSHWWVLY